MNAVEKRLKPKRVLLHPLSRRTNEISQGDRKGRPARPQAKPTVETRTTPLALFHYPSNNNGTWRGTDPWSGGRL